MIVSDELRYVFVEVPHTASTAIAKELKSNYAGYRVLRKHENYSVFRATCRPEQRGYFVFAAVRNPLDAFVTEYYKFLNDHRGDYSNTDNYAINGGWVVDEHVEKYQFTQQYGDDFPAYFKRFLASTYHNWYLLNHGKFSYVMRFEDISVEFERVLRLLGVDPVRPLPILNKSQRPAEWHTVFDEHTRALAVRYYSPFFTQWGYRFPEHWEAQHHTWAKIQYDLLEAGVQFLGARFKLDPTSKTTARAKSLVRRFI